MARILLMNGPMKSGKDVAIEYLIAQGMPLVKRECKDKLHSLTINFFNLDADRYYAIYDDRNLKERPLPVFTVSHAAALDLCTIIPAIATNPQNSSGVELSIRQAMIFVSEVLCKPIFGKEYFGITRANSIQSGELAFDGSTGFVEELPPLLRVVPQKDILLLRIHRDGYEFSSDDSRGYIPDGVVDNTVDVYNNASLESYFAEVEGLVEKYILGEYTPRQQKEST